MDFHCSNGMHYFFMAFNYFQLFNQSKCNGLFANQPRWPFSIQSNHKRNLTNVAGFVSWIAQVTWDAVWDVRFVSTFSSVPGRRIILHWNFTNIVWLTLCVNHMFSKQRMLLTLWLSVCNMKRLIYDHRVGKGSFTFITNRCRTMLERWFLFIFTHDKFCKQICQPVTLCDKLYKLIYVFIYLFF